MKRVLIISSSPRENGNSERLCREFQRGAQEAGHEVEFVALRKKHIEYCIACDICGKLGHCFQDDDMNELVDKMEAADVLVLATPVYFYCMSGQLKVFIDRLQMSYLRDPSRIHGEVYLFATGGDGDTAHLEAALESIRGCTRDCFPSCVEKGALVVGNVRDLNDMDGNPALEQAYEMGRHA